MQVLSAKRSTHKTPLTFPWPKCHPKSPTTLASGIYFMDCSLPGSSTHEILQARTLKWVVIPFSRGSFWPKDLTCIPQSTHRLFTIWVTREAPFPILMKYKNYICKLHLVISFLCLNLFRLLQNSSIGGVTQATFIFLTVLKDRKSKVRVLTDLVPNVGFFLDYRWMPSPCVLTKWREWTLVSLFISIRTLIPSWRSCPKTTYKLHYLPSKCL